MHVGRTGEDFRSLLLGGGRDDDEKSIEDYPLESIQSSGTREAEEFQIRMLMVQKQKERERHTSIRGGQIYLGRKDYDQASFCFKQVLEQFPNDPDAERGLCIVYKERGDLHAAKKPPEYLEAIRCYVLAKAGEKIEDGVNALIDELTQEEAGIKETQKLGALSDLERAYKCLIQEEIILGYAIQFLQPDYFSERLSKKMKETQAEISLIREEIRKMSPELDQIGKIYGGMVKSKEDLCRLLDKLELLLKKDLPPQLKNEVNRLISEVNEPLKRYLLADYLVVMDVQTDQLKRWSLWKSQDLSKIVEACKTWIEHYAWIKGLSPKDYKKLQPTENIVTQIYYFADQNQTLLNKVANFFLEITSQAVKGMRSSAEVPLTLVDQFSVSYKQTFQSNTALQTKYINLSDDGRKRLGRMLYSHVQEQLAPTTCFARCFTGHSLKKKLAHLNMVSEEDLHEWMDEIGPLSMREKEDVLDLFILKKH